MSKERYELAVDGDLETLVDDSAQNGGEQDGTMFRWLLVASSLPNDASAEARDWASDFFEFELKRDEKLGAEARFEVAQWFIHGRNGVAQSANRGMKHLEVAAELNVETHVTDGFEEMRNALPDKERGTFDALFPGRAE